MSKFDEWWQGPLGLSTREERFDEQAKRLDISETHVLYIKGWLEQAFSAGYEHGHYDCYNTYSPEEDV